MNLVLDDWALRSVLLDTPTAAVEEVFAKLGDGRLYTTRRFQARLRNALEKTSGVCGRLSSGLDTGNRRRIVAALKGAAAVPSSASTDMEMAAVREACPGLVVPLWVEALAVTRVVEGALCCGPYNLRTSRVKAIILSCAEAVGTPILELP